MDEVNPKIIRIFVQHNRFHLVDHGRTRRRHDQEQQRDQVGRKVHHHVLVAGGGLDGQGLDQIFLVLFAPVKLNADPSDDVS